MTRRRKNNRRERIPYLGSLSNIYMCIYYIYIYIYIYVYIYGAFQNILSEIKNKLLHVASPTT